jgi:hypothetical protein
MIKTELRMIEADVVVDHVCDCCGKSCSTEIPLFGASTIGTNFGTLSAVWGWGSAQDGDSHSAELCETCYTAVVTFLDERRATLLA